MNRTVHHPPCWATRSWLPAVSLVIGMILFFAWTADVAVGESNEALARKIIAAWKKRAKRIRTVRAEIVTHLNVHGQHIHGTGPVTYSRDDVTTATFDFENNRQRYEYHGGIFHADLQRVIHKDEITVVADGKCKQFSNSPAYPEVGVSEKGQGFLFSHIDYRAHFVLRSTKMRPLLWYIRPLGADLPGLEDAMIAPDTLKVERTVRSSAGQFIQCALPEETRMWVDPRMDFCIVRLKRPTREFNVTYTQDMPHVYVPKRWSVVRYTTTGDVKESWSCLVKRLELNASLDPSIFKYTFPEGATVHVVTESGPSPTMVAARGGGLRSARSQQQAPTRRLWSGLLIGNVVLVLLIAVLLVYQRIRRAQLA